MAGSKAPPLKPMYSIAELARIFKLHRNQATRIMKEAEITFTTVGRRRYVTLDEVEEKLPKLWRSVFLASDCGCRPVARPAA